MSKSAGTLLTIGRNSHGGRSITAGTYGLNIDGFSTFTGGITNTGTITGDGYTGIYMSRVRSFPAPSSTVDS
jgi:hypothetical protein